MNRLFYLMIVFAGLVPFAWSDEFQKRSVLEPPMPLSQDLPVSISQENRRQYLQNPVLETQETERAQAYLESKAVPWFILITSMVVSVGVILIRSLPSSVIEEHEDSKTNEIRRQVSIEELKKLANSMPNDKVAASAFFVTLDHALRNYLDSTYQMGAVNSTAHEISRKIDSNSALEPALSHKIVQVFHKSELVKFAKIPASPADTVDAINMISSLILSPQPRSGE